MSNPLITGALYSDAPASGTGAPSVAASTAVVVDGTPMRVAALGVAAGLTVWALRKAGFKFNVGVS